MAAASGLRLLSVELHDINSKAWKQMIPPFGPFRQLRDNLVAVNEKRSG